MLDKTYNGLPFRLRFFTIHLVFWALFLFLPVGDFMRMHDTVPISFFIKILFCIAIFYFNYFVVVPQLLLKNKPLLYALAIVVLIGTFSYIFSKFEGPPPFRHNQQGIPKPPMQFKKGMHVFPNIIMFSLHILLSSVLKMYVEWNASYKKQKETETEQKTSELNFLKAQLNPHFFFNSLNTIYSLSIKKSDTTPVAVLNLADLMRYMLYETNKEMVRLTDELSYIESYIELQKLRLTENNKVYYEVEGNPHGISLPPLLFICFIENAFKHGVTTSRGSEISIKFTITNNQVRMLAVNDINPQATKDDKSGLGIDNTLRRIKLYYPESYKLETFSKNNKFYADLAIDLNGN